MTLLKDIFTLQVILKMLWITSFMWIPMLVTTIFYATGILKKLENL